MNDRIAKEKLNIILIVDSSKSMQGGRINQVNQAVLDIKDYLTNLQVENAQVDFYMTIVSFANNAQFYKNQPSININAFNYEGIECRGYSNLHMAYDLLETVLKKESKGGMMPDFGGAAPIILLLTDGHPTGEDYKKSFDKIKDLPWFKVALRYGIAIELNDKRTMDVLQQFVGNNGDVVQCYNANMLKNIIKIIVLTASKVKSTSSNVKGGAVMSQNQQVQQLIAEQLSDTDNWEW